MEFKFHLPVNIIFGCGKVNTIGEEAKKLGKKVLIVTGKNSTKKTGLLDRVIKLLEQENISSVVFDKVEPNPLVSTVEHGVLILKENNCDIVLGLGGGSPMDCAKAISFFACNPGDINEYIFGKEGTNSTPLILMTTTAGTGSEGDSISVLTNSSTNDKKGLKKPCMYADVSIVDPELMTTMPKSIIAATCFDALSHCIEAYVSKLSQPFTDALALMAIESISKNIRSVYENPKNITAWEKIAYSNTIGGMAIDIAGIAITHGMEHPVSGLLDVVHGQGLAAIFPAFIKNSASGNYQKFANIAKALGENVNGLNIEETAFKCEDGIKKLLKDIDLNYTLSDLGVKEDMLNWMTDNCIKVSQPGINNNPVLFNREQIYEIYKQSL
ncbi:MAG: iron-containing alcohol dehydrogenase [Clostridiales bacterium]